MRSNDRSERVRDLLSAGVLWVEDGNHGENRPLSDEFDSEGTPFVRPDDLAHGMVNFEECDRINPKAVQRIRKGKGRPGDIAFTHRATVGRIARVGPHAPDFVANPGVTLWRVLDKATLDPNFLYYFMQTPFFMNQVWAEAGNTDTFPYISLTQQRGLELRFPAVSLQRAIGEVLGAIDDRVAVLRETNATLEAIALALFKSWFVDFDPVRAKQQGLAPAGMDEATAALFPDRFEESALGLMPAAWETAKLGAEASYLNRGISPKYVDVGGVMVINQKCIRDFKVDLSKARRHDDGQRGINGRELRVGDLLVNSTGVGTLGRVAQVLTLDEPTIVDSHVTVVRAGGRLSWNYLGLAMMRRQAEIEELGEGTTGQTELNRGKLAGLAMVVPPSAVLEAFDASTLPLRMRLAANSHHAQTLAALRDTLLPRLISGQLRLSEVEAVAEAALDAA